MTLSCMIGNTWRGNEETRDVIMGVGERGSTERGVVVMTKIGKVKALWSNQSL